MIARATPAPAGFERVASYTFPTQWGPWRPSKVHLRPAGSYGGPLCGARLGRKRSHGEGEFRDHERDAGLCSRCWAKAGA